MIAPDIRAIHLHVAVTGDDIRRGTIADPCFCGVALAVTRAAGEVMELSDQTGPVAVTPECVTVYDAEHRRWLAHMPAEGRALVNMLDAGANPGNGPHTFELTLERT